MIFALVALVGLPPSTALQPLSPATPPLRTRASVVLRGGGATQGLQGAWNKYLRLLEEKPMSTKMATSAVLSGTGDCIAQLMEASGGFALRRFFTIISVNVLYIVPVLTAFYAANEALAKSLKLDKGWQRTGVQLAFDQLLNAPIVIAGFFCSFQLATTIADVLLGTGAPGMGALVSSVRAQLLSSWASTVVTNWKIWVLPQLLNFAIVPPYGRVAFANVIALVWNVVLSVIANK